MFKDYYKILDIHRHATAQEIKSAYRAMSMKWHPDKNPGTDVTNIMQDINEAYAILKDTNKRERYNQEYDIFYAQLSFNSHKVSDNDFSKEYEYDYDIKDDILKDDIADARKYGRTRQTLWRAVQMLTQKLCCQTIHDCPKVVPLHYESEWQ